MTARTKSIGAIVFLALSLWLAVAAPKPEIGLVLTILLLTVFLFAFELVRVDVAAVGILVLLGLLSSFSGLLGLEPLVAQGLFQGFASNAVTSIIAVMIIGAGLDKTGLMGRVGQKILKVAGQTEARIIPAIAGTVGAISSFMQNVGAAALFLPVVARIAARTNIPLSRLLMPMGFSAILGGTITMIGSSPLILLNDLILAANQTLPAESQMATWSLFSVTPIGLALLAAGIGYFVLFGRYVLPSGSDQEIPRAVGTLQYFQDLYGLDYAVSELQVQPGSPLVGLTLDELERAQHVRVIAVRHGREAPRIGLSGLSREIVIEVGMVLGVLAAPERIASLTASHGLELHDGLQLAEALSPQTSGIAEIVIPPGSSLIGKAAREVSLRKSYELRLGLAGAAPGWQNHARGGGHPRPTA